MVPRPPSRRSIGKSGLQVKGMALSKWIRLSREGFDAMRRKNAVLLLYWQYSIKLGGVMKRNSCRLVD